jgi:hypothetical protein
MKVADEIERLRVLNAELVKALNQLRGFCYQRGYDDLYAIADAAIAKAEGET